MPPTPAKSSRQSSSGRSRTCPDCEARTDRSQIACGICGFNFQSGVFAEGKADLTWVTSQVKFRGASGARVVAVPLLDGLSPPPPSFSSSFSSPGGERQHHVVAPQGTRRSHPATCRTPTQPLSARCVAPPPSPPTPPHRRLISELLPEVTSSRLSSPTCTFQLTRPSSSFQHPGHFGIPPLLSTPASGSMRHSSWLMLSAEVESSEFVPGCTHDAASRPVQGYLAYKKPPPRRGCPSATGAKAFSYERGAPSDLSNPSGSHIKPLKPFKESPQPLQGDSAAAPAWLVCVCEREVRERESSLLTPYWSEYTVSS